MVGKTGATADGESVDGAKGAEAGAGGVAGEAGAAVGGGGVGGVAGVGAGGGAREASGGVSGAGCGSGAATRGFDAPPESGTTSKVGGGSHSGCSIRWRASRIARESRSA
jgi:hypothetical protein